MRTTCNHALYSIVDVFSQYFDTLHDVVLTDLYSQLTWCVQQGKEKMLFFGLFCEFLNFLENENLAKSAINCLETVVISNGLKFTPDIWNRTVNLLINLFNATLPQT